jgi:hypothetical protein
MSKLQRIVAYVVLRAGQRIRRLFYNCADRLAAARWDACSRHHKVAYVPPATERSLARHPSDSLWLLDDLAQFEKQNGGDRFSQVCLYPVLADRTAESGAMSGDYFHQDLYVAQQIFLANPRKHVDVGSRQHGFVAHVASFREIEIIDIRPQASRVRNVAFRQADMMQLPPDLLNYCDSISSLHAI